MGDSDVVDCEGCREIVSADLDAEATVEQSWAADQHLARCPACRHWSEQAAALTRRARSCPAETSPDLVGPVLRGRQLGRPETAGALPPPPEPSRRLRLLASGEAGDPSGSRCGCTASCTCGCQQGRPCRCKHHAAA